MSVELDWTLLDRALADSLLSALNNTLASTARPAFIGPIVATSLDFGSEPPDAQLIHIGDIDTLFLDRTDRQRAAALADEEKQRREQEQRQELEDEQEEAEREAAVRREAQAARNGRLNGGPRRPRPHPQAQHQHQHQHRRASTPDSNLGSPLGSGSVLGIGIGYGYGSGMRTPSATPWQPQAAIIAAAMRAQARDREAARHIPAPPTRQPSVADVRTRLPVSGFPSPLDEHEDPTRSLPPGNSATAAPSLQIQLRTRWRSSTVRCNIRTSLVINIPSPHFMSLDVSISLVGLTFDGVLIIAIEGEKRKMHISLMEYDEESEDEDEVEEEDEEQNVDAAGSRPETSMPPPLGRSFTTNNALLHSPPDHANPHLPNDELVSPTPPPKPRPLLPADPALSPLASRIPLPPTSADDGAPLHPPRPPPFRSQSAAAYLSSSGFFGSPIPATPGARLLPSLTFESSVGEEDKHVLKNVGKVEKFVQDMIRKVIEDQLLFPKFKTVDLKKKGTGQGK
ncbi:unnamed protein product [Tilletia controversa]|uniref:Mitochondrial distribution and morphology protein 12 n=3 Tax=Tilletia TaxID=13289 RepID=A0A8X7MQY0_9BASI|nr:hypothetical protein CF336_g5302 [Tilletia laevis]KAE8193880.1 hypothetical protein CF328_g4912 [Tilletia controversa]KAE8256556.1 hypothetical protein A4X03_0g5288 [Tilletia caries]KAE8197230.1 hypothetical protein CF335_g4669 [Tilletia laevis]KAE8246089.1 hypothetical protein A4X06_0g5197 [Tilletia controversa]